MRRRLISPRPRGLAAVELALVMIPFTLLLIGVMEMGRLLWVWNAATEATRFGARMAVVCDINDGDIKTRMAQRMPDLSASQITIDYLNPPAAVNSCTTANCKAVSVHLHNYSHSTLFLPLTLTLPPFTTTLRKEYMESANNPVCS